MEENNELKDLVLDDKDDGSNSRKMRKLLIIIASLVILFLIILFVMKMLNSSDNTAQNDGRVIIPPEIETVQKSEPNDTIFEQVPILQDENSSQKQSFEDIVKNLKEKEELRQQATINNKDSLPTQPVVQKEEYPKTQETKKDVATKTTDTKTENKPTTKKDTTATTKTEAKKDTKPIKQSVSINNKKTTNTSKSASNASGVSAGTYIQVASVTKVNTNSELFKKLKNNGYDYKVYETTINGKKINKILVGSYDNAKVDDALKDIRSKINPNAFIFRVK
ncbi:SPOR domain-containing protein [Campylobacter sp. RM12327]|uniref:SPOR domain-containing protein n=1 Tax=Campylobacter sputorum TaxID=206 RepID=UPI00189650D6|nr:SPOR domain-containing protein [Campylobacter sp. RM12327]MBF6669187.1 SPOR domain-containing protein [Campylobacter sp. RM12327]